MRLPAWRETFLWLALGACSPASWATNPPARKVSAFEVPLFANATYVARIEVDDRDRGGPVVTTLKGTLQCEQALSLIRRGYVADAPERADTASACPPDVANVLAGTRGALFVVDASGPRWLTTAQVVAAVSPIDSPAKAALVAWASGRELEWAEGDQFYGGLEDSRVRAVAGGFEVATGTRTEQSDCGGKDPRGTVMNYRVVVFVAPDGVVTERTRTKTASHEIADPCHPHGRRPAGFVAHASDGTVRGLVQRLMHDEAESVRAFERIARELRAHGAPDELVVAAEQAARDERDHAERCAALIGEPAVIAGDALPVRSLLACALDNAREGCVGETYAALAAVVQAHDAEAPALRAHFAAIAVDELAHAALAHALADWFDTVLPDDERRIVAAARATAAAELRASFPDAASPAMRALGMPAGPDARRLLDAATAA